MNILILNWRDVSHAKSGGAEIVTMEHAKGWVKMGHSVTWFTSGYNNMPKNETIHGVNIVRRAGSQTVYLVAPLYILMNAYKFDVVVDEVHGIPFFSPLFTRKPIVVFIHEIAGQIWDFMYPFPLNIVGKSLESFFFFLYRKNLFWTDAPSTIQELAKRGIPEKNCTAIPCPISTDTKIIQKLKNFKKEQRHTFVFVSRVVRMKGIEEVIKAFSFIVREEPKSVLWIIGGGEKEYIEKLKHMISEYGVEKNIQFLGKLNEEEKLSRMARAHLLLHASVKEGWGLVVLEAAAVGTPTVAYNVSGLCDVVKNGKTGVIIEDNSPHTMAKMTLQLLGDTKRYAKFQINGKKWVQSLTWKDVVQKSISLLEKAV